MFRFRCSYILLTVLGAYFFHDPLNTVVLGLMDPIVQQKNSSLFDSVAVKGIAKNNNNGIDSFENDYIEDLLEKECPEGQWWHLRGQRCVPIYCIGGNKFRDVQTGVCFITKSWYRRGIERSFLRYTPRTVMRSKARTRFSLNLPTKIKG